MASLFSGTLFESHKDLDEYAIILSEPNKKKRRSGLAKFRALAKKTPLADRVFVCLGTLNHENNGRPHAWVMTINREFDIITFWEPRKHINYTLEGRINRLETEWMKNYLSPQLTVKEKKSIRQKKTKALKQKEKELKKKQEQQAQQEADRNKKSDGKKGGFKNINMLNELLKAKEQDMRNGKILNLDCHLLALYRK
jgi:hypothetical protein